MKGYPNASIGSVNDFPETKDEKHEGMKKYSKDKNLCSYEQ